MKLEKDHVVPLSEAAMAIFGSLPITEDSDLLFPAPESRELSDSAFGALIDSMHETNLKQGGTGYFDPQQNRIVTQHGFRSWCAHLDFRLADIQWACTVRSTLSDWRQAARSGRSAAEMAIAKPTFEPRSRIARS